MRGEIVVVCETREKVRAYVHALRSLGVAAERLRVLIPDVPHPGARQLAANAAGLVLCGGPDLEPWRYGEEPRADADLSLYPELDQLEWELVEGAREGRTPVWAICRGLQLVNVYLGGTLWQDLPSQVAEAADHDPGGAADFAAHELERVDRGSPFGELLDRPEAAVNSRHHQAVRELATPLAPVAYAPDGVLEVVELREGDWWLRGVQWHPEDMVEVPLQRRLWLDFVAVADAPSTASPASP